MVDFTQYAPYLAIAGLVMVALMYAHISKMPAGNDRMLEIGKLIHDGAMTYLRTQYLILLVFLAIVAILLGIFINVPTAIAYIFGGFSSMIAGFIGMKGATKANLRTA